MLLSSWQHCVHLITRNAPEWHNLLVFCRRDAGMRMAELPTWKCRWFSELGGDHFAHGLLTISFWIHTPPPRSSPFNITVFISSSVTFSAFKSAKSYQTSRCAGRSFESRRFHFAWKIYARNIFFFRFSLIVDENLQSALVLACESHQINVYEKFRVWNVARFYQLSVVACCLERKTHWS